jgi:hypothetical protein
MSIQFTPYDWLLFSGLAVTFLASLLMLRQKR